MSELETYDNIRAASFLAMRVLRPGRFHQDEHRQDLAQCHARQQPGDDRGDPRFLSRDRHRDRDEARRRHPHGEAGAALSRRGEGDARRRVAEQHALPLRRESRCSTICCGRSRRKAPVRIRRRMSSAKPRKATERHAQSRPANDQPPAASLRANSSSAICGNSIPRPRRRIRS